MSADARFGAEEELLDGGAAAFRLFQDAEEFAAFALWPVEDDREFAAHAGEVGDGHPFERFEVFDGVELTLPEAEDLLAGAGPGGLGAHREDDLAVPFDADAERQAAVDGAFDDPERQAVPPGWSVGSSATRA